MLKLKNEIKMFLENEEETNLQAINLYLVKNKISDSCIVLLATKDTPHCFGYNFTNQILYDVKKKEILFVFSSVFHHLFMDSDYEVQKVINSCTRIYSRLQTAIKKEFETILSEISLEKELLTDKVVESMAKEAFEKGQILEYQIPYVSDNIAEFSYSLLEEVQRDIHDAAYNLMESYLEKHPAYLRGCQRIYAAKLLYNKMTGMLSEEEKEKAEILNLIKNPAYKSLRIKTRTNDGKFLEDSYKTSSINLASFPYWIVEEISYSRKVLYQCKIKDLYKWEHNKVEIMNKISAMSYYEVQRDKSFFLSWFPKEMLEDEDILKIILQKNVNLFLELKKTAELDLEFFENLSKVSSKNFLRGLSYQLLRQNPALLNDKDSVLALFSYGYDVYSYLPEKLMYDVDILKSCLERNLRFNYSDIFTAKGVGGRVSEKEQKELLEFIDNLANEGNFELKFPIGNEEIIENCVTNIELAQLQCIYHEKFLNFKHIVVDETFVLQVLKSTSICLGFGGFNNINWGYYNSLPIALKTNKVIGKEFIEKGLNSGITSKEFYTKFWFIFDSLDEIEEVIKRRMQNHFLINFLDESDQLKVIESYPAILSSVFRDTSSLLYETLMNTKFDFLIEIALKNPVEFPWTNLNENQIIQVLQKDLSMIKFIPKYQINTQKIMNYLVDKTWVLDVVEEKGFYYDYKVHPFDDKEFLRKQTKFNSDILGYIPKATKKLNPYSLQDDKDFVLELIQIDSRNIYGLDKNSKFFKDLEFAKVVLAKEPNAYSLFGKRVLSSKELREDLETKLSEKEIQMIYS